MHGFNPELLQIAREAEGLTQAELAALCSVHQNEISRWESGLRSPLVEDVRRLAMALDRDVSFFYRTDFAFSIDSQMVFHRARKCTQRKVLRLLHAKFNAVLVAITALLSRFKPWENRIPHIPITPATPPASIALELRKRWMLGMAPIRNLVGLVEAAGAIIVRFDFGCSDVDAIALKRMNLKPIFFLNSTASADRIRFSVAHELGHVVMHERESESMESEADEFAAEFLFPTASVKSELRSLSPNALWLQKQRWRVSAACIIKRAAATNLIDENEERRWWATFSKRGWRKSEPYPISEESPSTLNALLASAIDDHGMSKEELRCLLGATHQEFESVYGMGGGGSLPFRVVREQDQEDFVQGSSPKPR